MQGVAAVLVPRFRKHQAILCSFYCGKGRHGAKFTETRIMGVYFKNRMLMISLALAASGILTCGLALADTFLPQGSTLVVLASIPLLAVAAMAVLVAFAWACELLDRRGGLRVLWQTACNNQTLWHVVTGGPKPGAADGRQAAPKTAVPLRPLIG
jgi:hypothetical protein